MSDPTIDDRQQLIADLQAARSELVARGWCTEDFLNTAGQVCALGAVRAAITNGAPERWQYEIISEGDVLRHMAAQRALEASLIRDPGGRCSRGTCGHVDCFNDHSASGVQDVLNLFDKALAGLGGLA